MIDLSLPWQVIHGDCLDVMRGLPDGCVDAVVTDPPYSSGGMMRGDRTSNNVTGKYQQSGTQIVRPEFGGDSRDQRSFTFWCSWWLNECYRLCRNGAAVAVFTDWRQLPSVTDALQSGGFVWRGIAVWDKVGGRPTMGRPRSQAEYVVWGSKGPMGTDRNAKMIPGVIQCTVRQDDKHHVTGKPTDVMRWINGIAEEGSLILDPFAGSGSTGVPAVGAGYRFLGIEREAAYVDIARRRIADAAAQGNLFTGDAA